MLRLLLTAALLLPASARTPQWTKDDVIRRDVEDVPGEPLSETDFEMAELLPEIPLENLGIRTDHSSNNPVGDEEKLRKGINEGDIKVKSEFENVKEFAKESDSLTKNAIASKWRQWPRGEIPYQLSSQYSSYSRRTIASAIAEYHKRTCIRFIPRDPSKHRDYIYIHPDDGCYSLVGRTGGRQSLSLDSGCIQKGTIIHEMMHTVGFFHEQSRTDRDDHIRIEWDNVMSDAVDQFEKYSLRTITSLGEDYDYGSIMHYGPRAFSRNGRETIVPISRTGARLRVTMGQREAFSTIDLKKINKLYRCPSEEEEKPKPRPRPEASGEDSKCKDDAGSAGGSLHRCQIWKDNDFCPVYETVRRRCRKTCGLCSEDSPPTTTTTEAPTTTTEEEWEDGDEETDPDQNDSCEKWAMERDLCDKPAYRSLMQRICPASCAKARRKGPDSSECQDSDSSGRCALISGLGRCPGVRVVKGQKCLTRNGWSNRLAFEYFESCRDSCSLCDVKICKIVVRNDRRG